MKVSVNVNSIAARRSLNKMIKSQLPYATALAMTRTAQGAVSQLKKESRTRFDRPTPWTQKGFTSTSADKKSKRIRAYVSIRPQQWKYMSYQVQGGTRRPTGTAIPVPTNNLTDRNRYGNMRKNQLKKIIKYERTFSGVPKGGNRPGGVWYRYSNNKRLKSLILWEDSAKYTKRFPFKKIVNTYARKHYAANFRRAFNQAVRTAK
jgi:hypothetical protein